MILVKHKDKLFLQAPYDQRELVKAIGDYRWNKQRQIWEFPLNKIVSILDSLNIDATPEIKALYQEYKAKEQERSKKLEYVQSLYSKN